MRVYFDESGNTGVNLSDPAQPAFSLASVAIDGDVAHALVAPLIRTGQREVKYTSLSSSASGQKALLRLLQSPHINSSAIKVAVTDKRYYLVAHLVDKIIEPVFHERGIDLYAEGRHVGYTNVLYQAGRHLFPDGGWQKILDSFLNALRDTSASVLNNFEATVLRAAANAPPGYSEFVVPLMIGAREAGTLLDGLSVHGAFDPAVDAFNALIQAWMLETRQSLCVVHDTSKPIKKAESFLRRLMSADVAARTIGYADRKAELPMRVSTLEFSDSREYPQLQLADVIAGVARDCVAGKLKPEKWTSFHETALPFVDKVMVNRMLPDPTSVGVTERSPIPGEKSLADGAASFLSETEARATS